MGRGLFKMKFNDLPLLLKPMIVSQITGLDTKQIRALGDSDQLEVIRINNGYRYYSRESLRRFLNVKGEEQVPE